MELSDIRKQIDGINQDLLRLFEERMELSRSVAAYKLEHQMEVLVPAREVEIMEWVQNAASPNLVSFDTAFFNTILSLSREYQSELIRQTQAAPKRPRGIKTDRLLLLPLEKGDAVPVFSLTSDPEVAKFMRFDTHTDIKEAEALIDEYNAGNNLAYKMLTQEKGEFVGVFAFKPDPKAPCEVEMSIFMGRDHWGKGYLTEILEMAKAAGADLLNAGSLWGYVVEANTSCCRGLEKAGFVLNRQLTFPDWDGILNVYRCDLI